MIKKIGVLVLLLFACNVYADIEVTGKFAPKNNGFTGLIDADQILGGSVRIPTNTIPTHIYISSISSVDGLNWIGIYINDIEVSSFTVSGFHTSVINWADGTVQVSSPTAGGGGGGTPGGSDTEIQYNNSTAFGGVSNFTFNGTTVAITIPFEVSTITWSNGTVQVSSPAASLWQTESDGVALLVDDEILQSRNIRLTSTNGVIFRHITADQSNSGSISSPTGDEVRVDGKVKVRLAVNGTDEFVVTATDIDLKSNTITSPGALQSAWDLNNQVLTNANIDSGIITGITDLVVADGGTGVSTLGDAGVLIGNGTSAVQVTGAGTSGQVLTSNGAGVDPTFQVAAGGADTFTTIQTDGSTQSTDAPTLDFGTTDFTLVESPTDDFDVRISAIQREIREIFYIEDPTAADSFPICFVSTGATIVNVFAETDTGTVDFNIEIRSHGSAEAAGTDIDSTEFVADDDGLKVEAGSITTTEIAGESWLHYSASAIASSPTKLWVAITYTVD